MRPETVYTWAERVLVLVMLLALLLAAAGCNMMPQQGTTYTLYSTGEPSPVFYYAPPEKADYPREKYRVTVAGAVHFVDAALAVRDGCVLTLDFRMTISERWCGSPITVESVDVLPWE